MINADNVKAEDDDELSDEEEDMDATDGEQTKEEAEAHECGDHSFLTGLMESFIEKVSFLKSRDGRAGLVHNFLRGLEIITAPVPKGETLMLFSNISSFLYFARKKITQTRLQQTAVFSTTRLKSLINSFKLP